MSDLEMVRLCAEAMEISVRRCCGSSECADQNLYLIDGHSIYDPLTNDAQAMALVKRFNPMMHNIDGKGWTIAIEWAGPSSGTLIENQPDLNHAIAEAVARMQQAK